MQPPPQAHPLPAGPEFRTPPDVEAAKTEIRRMTCVESQLGHAGSASRMPRSRSKSDPHVEHSYSYSGMREVYAALRCRADIPSRA